VTAYAFGSCGTYDYIDTVLGMWQIPNPHPNPTESGTFPEIRNPLDT